MRGGINNMKIVTSANSGEWIKIAVEGVQSIIRSNQYGRKFFTLYGNTFPIKDRLSQLGFKFFKGTWGKAVDTIDDNIKNELEGMGIDVTPLDLVLDVPQEKEPATPLSEVPSEKTAVEKTEVEKELDRMKDGVTMAMKQEGGEKVKGLLGFVDRMIERVAQMTDEASQSDFVKNFLEFAARFHDYSFHNQMLIWVQKPSATYVKGFKQWMELGREVKNWDNGIVIIAPMFKKMKYSPEELAGKTQDQINAMPQQRVFFSGVSVYDVSDTQPIANWEKMKGKKPFEPPKLKTEPNEAMEEITALVNSVTDWAKEKNIDVDFEKMNEDLGGYSAGGKIRVNDSFQGINLFSTMIHECAHEVLHWVEAKDGKKSRPAGQPESRQSKEIDAETTAYIVLKHYGFESKDAPNYLALWKAKGEDIKARRENIRKSVQAIIEGIDSKIKANVVEAGNRLKFKISKSQWKQMGKKAGWNLTKKEMFNAVDSLVPLQKHIVKCEECGDVIPNYFKPDDPIYYESPEQRRDRYRILCNKCRYPKHPEVSDRGGSGHYHSTDDLSGASSSWDNVVRLYEGSVSGKTIKISKSQWKQMGKKAGWLDDAVKSPRMMPGQTPYTEEEVQKLNKMVGDASMGDPGEEKEDDLASKRRIVRVTFDDGDVIQTPINGNKKEIEDYYLKQEPTDTWNEKRTHKPVKVEFLD